MLFFAGGIGLMLIFWSQVAMDMWQHPNKTAALLLAILLCALLTSFLFEGRIWCRYLCPLGQMVATFARTAILELRSNGDYCSNECDSYVCSTGNGEVNGCSMIKGPFLLSTNQNCTLCGNCIKTCPNQSVRLNRRPPGWELWNARSADFAAIIFIPLLWGSQLFRGMENGALVIRMASFLGSHHMALTMLLILCVAFAFHVAVAGIAFIGMVDTDAGVSFGSTFVLAMLPLIYANEIALRLVSLLNQAATFFTVLGNQIGVSLPDIAFRLDLQSIHFLQVITIACGLFCSLFVANKLTKNIPEKYVAPAFFRHLPLFAMAVISVVLL